MEKNTTLKSFYATTTAEHAEHVMKEIFRVDPDATITHRRDNKTLLLVRSKNLSEWTIEAIAGVAHAVNLSAIKPGTVKA